MEAAEEELASPLTIKSSRSSASTRTLKRRFRKGRNHRSTLGSFGVNSFASASLNSDRCIGFCNTGRVR
jgi:hypothetical protein